MTNFRFFLRYFIFGLSLLNWTNFVFAGYDGHKEILSLGGQAKIRGDFIENQNLGDVSFNPGTNDEQFVSRTRLNLSLKPIEQVNAFVQGQFYDRQNHSDYSQTNLYQAFLELSPVVFPLSLKLGRQEFCYGSAFFLGANDFYDGLVWDGAKLKILPKDNLWMDLVAARFVQLNKNTSKKEPALYGAYSEFTVKEDISADIYFFYHKGGFKFFHSDLPDSANWFTLGTRLAGTVKKQFDFEIEPLYQFGKIDNPQRLSSDTINTYGGHIETGYTFNSNRKPRIFTGYAFGRGDNDTTDKEFGEFHGNIYNDNYLVGDTSLLPDLSGLTVGSSRASGMHIFVGGVSADISPKLNLNLDCHYFVADKIPSGINNKLGSEVNLIFTYELFRDINITAGANRFFTGRFFKDAAGTGKDIDYFYAQTQFEF